MKKTKNTAKNNPSTQNITEHIGQTGVSDTPWTHKRPQKSKHTQDDLSSENEPSSRRKTRSKANPAAQPPFPPTASGHPSTKSPPEPAPRPESAKESRKEQPVTSVAEEKAPMVVLDQSVAILIDGNNIEMSLHSVSGSKSFMINFDKLVPALLMNRALSRLIYFREGKSISGKLAERLQKMFHGSVVPCYKSADIPLTIKAVQIASKVDTIIILSGDADYVELVRHLKHNGLRVEIAAFPETAAEVLLNEADYFFPITVDYSFMLK